MRERSWFWKGKSAQWGAATRAGPVWSAWLKDNKQQHHKSVNSRLVSVGCDWSSKERGGKGKCGEQRACWDCGLWSQGEELPAQCPLLLGPNPEAPREMFLFKHQPLSCYSSLHLCTCVWAVIYTNDLTLADTKQTNKKTSVVLPWTNSH